MIGIILVTLFTISLFMFMTTFLTYNNPESPVLTNSQVNQTFFALNNTLTSFQITANNSQALLSGDEPSTTLVFLILKSAWKIPLNTLTFLKDGVTVFTSFVFVNLLGIGSSPFALVFSVINAILVITIVFLIIYFIRTGQAER